MTGGPAPRQQTVLPTDAVSGLFEAVLDATEEAIYNSLLQATDVTAQRPHRPRAARGCAQGPAQPAAVTDRQA